MPTVQVFSRLVYGAPNIYPANDVAVQFAVLLGKKTLSHSDIACIKALSFDVVQVADPASAIKGI